MNFIICCFAFLIQFCLKCDQIMAQEGKNVVDVTSFVTLEKEGCEHCIVEYSIPLSTLCCILRIWSNRIFYAYQKFAYLRSGTSSMVIICYLEYGQGKMFVWCYVWNRIPCYVYYILINPCSVLKIV